jgi:ABC-2 type transport system permease protein
VSAALAIARVNVVRMLRDRTGLFFVFLLPVVLIMVLGIAYGERVAPRLGVVAEDVGPMGEELVAAIGQTEMRLEVHRRATVDELRSGVEDGSLELGLVIPPHYDAILRSGGIATLELLGQPQSALSAIREGVAAAVADQSARVRAARVAVDQGAPGSDAALDAAQGIQASLPGVTVDVTSVGEATIPAAGGPFALGAQSQLVLFMFLTSMTAATQLILTRQLGVTRRMLATPTPVRSILAGELLGRFAVAMIQGVFIVLVSSALFNVAWGDLVGTGAAMVVGVFGSNPDQAGTLGVFAGMALGALGGAMVPLELFGEPMATLARLTPHAWAIDGFRDLAFRGAGLTGILTQLGVLLGFAAVLVGLGTWGLRRAITRG